MGTLLSRFTTSAVASLLAVGALAAAAPAANAATHKIDPQWRTSSQVVQVGAHVDRLTLRAATKRGVKVTPSRGFGPFYAAAKYRLTLTGAHKRVLYTTVLTTWRGLNAEDVAQFGAFASDAKLISALKRAASLSEARAKALVKRDYAELGREEAALFAVQLEVFNVGNWIDDQTDKNGAAPTSFDGYQLTFGQDSKYDVRLTGTPAYFKVTIKVAVSGATVAQDSEGTIMWSPNALAKNLQLG